MPLPNLTQPIPTDSASPAAVLQMLINGWAPQAIYAAAKLNIPDLLKNGPQSAAFLAERTGSDTRTLYRLLRALSGIGLLDEGPHETFSLTPMGHFLQSDVPGSLHAIAVMFGEEHYQAWGGILQSLKTGKSSFSHVFGCSVFEYFQSHPEASDIFNKAMTTFSQQSMGVAMACDFGRFSCLMDVAGGHGYLLSAILKANPGLKGLLFDLPHVAAGGLQILTEMGIQDRCDIVSGDFFKDIPAGADAYLLSHIIHDWDDERCGVILKNIHQVLPENGRLFLVETIIGSPKETVMSRFMDLNMLVMTEGGCERTENEFRTLLSAHGFDLLATHPVPNMERYVLEARKI